MQGENDRPAISPPPERVRVTSADIFGGLTGVIVARAQDGSAFILPDKKPIQCRVHEPLWFTDGQWEPVQEAAEVLVR